MSGLLKHEHHDYFKRLNNQEFLALTRYQYSVGLVMYALMYALLENKTNYALFWAYELYHSGYQLLLIDIIIMIYYSNYAIFNPEMELILLEQIINIMNNMHLIKNVSYYCDINDNDDVNVSVGNMILLFSNKKNNMDVLMIMQQCNYLSIDEVMNSYMNTKENNKEMSDDIDNSLDLLIDKLSNVNMMGNDNMKMKSEYTIKIMKMCKELMELEEKVLTELNMSNEEVINSYVDVYIQHVMCYYLSKKLIINQEMLIVQIDEIKKKIKSECMLLCDIVCHPTYGDNEISRILSLKLVSSMMMLFNDLERNLSTGVSSNITMMFIGVTNPFKCYDTNIKEYKNHIDEVINIYENEFMRYHNHSEEMMKELYENWLFYMAITPIWKNTLEMCYGAIICYDEKKVIFGTKKKEQEFNEKFGYYKIMNRILINYKESMDLMKIYKRYNTNSLMILNNELVEECNKYVKV